MRKLYIFSQKEKRDHNPAPFIQYKKFPQNQKIVMISPHADDIAVGCGGMAAMLAQDNTIIPILFFTGFRGVVGCARVQGTRVREQEMCNEAKCLGLEQPIFLRLPSYERDDPRIIDIDTKKVSALLAKLKPDLVFLPQKRDLQPRHLLATQITLTALKKTQQKPALLYYETVWSPFSAFAFNSVVPLAHNIIKCKIAAIRKHQSQLERTSFDSAARDLARFRAAVVPEQRINGYGGNIKKLAEFLEVFYLQKNNF